MITLHNDCSRIGKPFVSVNNLSINNQNYLQVFFDIFPIVGNTTGSNHRIFQNFKTDLSTQVVRNFSLLQLPTKIKKTITSAEST